MNLANWSEKSHLYEFRPDSGECKYVRRRGSSEEGCGFFKKTGAGFLASYTLQGEVWLWASGRAVRMRQQDFGIAISSQWPFLVTRIFCTEFRIAFKEFSPLTLVSAHMDPTYDDLDLGMESFGAYLVGRARQRQAS